MKSVRLFVYQLFFSAPFHIMKLYLASRRLNQLPAPFSFLREFPRKRIVKLYSCYISPKSNLSSDLYFPHPVGIVVGDGVFVGERCIIYQNVTLGAARRGDGRNGLYPRLGRSVTVYAGAVIVGNIKVGDGAIIGANAVVLSDIPDNAIAVGIPARIIGGNDVASQ